VLAPFAGSTRASCVFFSNFGVAYTCRIIDVPASTGYGEPIQKQFKLKDGEKIVAAMSLDPRAIGDIGTSDRAQGSCVPTSRPSTPSPRRATATRCASASSRSSSRAPAPAAASRGRSKGRKIVGVARFTGGEILIAATAEARGILCKADEVNYLSGPGKGVLLIKLGRATACSASSPPAATAICSPWRRRGRRTDHQHDEIRGDGPRRQGRELLQRGQFTRFSGRFPNRLRL
jgi:DNA gyrase subunit A